MDTGTNLQTKICISILTNAFVAKTLDMSKFVDL